MDFQSGDFRPIQARRQTNPIESNPRRPTDRLWVILFPLILIAWLVVGILKFCGNQIHVSDGQENTFNLIITIMNAPILRPIGSTFVLTLLMTAIGVFLYTVLAESITKILVYLGFGFYFLSTIGWITRAIVGVKNITLMAVYLSQISENSSFWILITVSLIILASIWLVAIYMCTSTLSYLKADKKVLCDITQDSCRVILGSPLIVLFMEIMVILASLVFSFTFNALFFDLFLERSEPLRYCYLSVILFGGFCALYSIVLFAATVISEYTINYYWKEDEKSIFLLGRSIVNTLRNHIGTIMFASTVLVSTICAIVQAFKHKRTWKHKDDSIYYFVSKVYLVLRMSDNALIFASIYGTDFVKSSQKAFDVVLRKPLLFLAILGVYEGVFLLIPTFILSILLTIAIFTVTSVRDLETEEGLINISLVIYGLIYTFICVALLMYFIMKALLINKILILNREDQDTEGKGMILHPRM